ncbi:MAG: hypothetical protein R3C12_13920 [Planctomycetaceae bacterium]|nr:hypothetical protein [Planctomycetaceae bacterium]
MDKLKPVIQHHFWILFGLVLILPLVGWMPAVKQFSQQTTEKITKIEDAFKQVPGGMQANGSWSEKLNVKAQKAEDLNLDARYGLWKRQEAMMVWPSTIKRELQPKFYREEISPIARNIYKNNYNVEVKNLWRKADPFNVETGKGTVVFPESLMPQTKFGDLTPNSEELWDAQEDLWLVESLLNSIRRANSDASLVTESLVRSISVLRLVGGTGDYPDATPPAGSGGEYGSSEEEGGFFETGAPPGDDPFAGGGMTEGTGSLGIASVTFNPADEFGEEQGRYVDYKTGTVFKKRGFYLEAIIDHQRLPKLLAELTNNSWPVTITRVQMAQANPMSGPGMGMGYGSEGSSLLGGGGSSYTGDTTFNPYPMPAGPMPAGPMPGGSVPMEDGAFRQDGTSSEFASLASAAQFGPQLAVVAISGLIHIYNPPENLVELREKAEAAAAAPAAQAESEPAPPEEPGQPAASPAPVPEVPESPDDLTPTPAPTPDQPEIPADPAETPPTPEPEPPAN